MRLRGGNRRRRNEIMARAVPVGDSIAFSWNIGCAERIARSLGIFSSIEVDILHWRLVMFPTGQPCGFCLARLDSSRKAGGFLVFLTFDDFGLCSWHHGRKF
ncbi:unnamed protein product [Ostreobium quekettii]|uniref:Uncharacterized protein n=1 Tax=Ostreobium quekettii TaxID=121088 RepID=A0A8S1INW0_9CHLO|nr:unnamed protein product [Ostreobium quekettii]